MAKRKTKTKTRTKEKKRKRRTMAERELRTRVCDANRRLSESGLVMFSWGNVSGINEKGDIIAIKPSGVPYDILNPKDIVLIDLEGTIVEGRLKPSSDTRTHLVLYKHFTGIGGIVHTHSMYATAWAQAGRELPCLGTTHADTFCGEVPVTRVLTDAMIENEYVKNTGHAIVECFEGKDPVQVPACLVQNHGPFVWGKGPEQAVENSIILEKCAQIGLYTITLNDNAMPIKRTLLHKHYFRKHGENSQYGQK